MRVLAINTGSSSLKFKVLDVDDSSKSMNRPKLYIEYEGAIEEIGRCARSWIRHAGTRVEKNPTSVSTHGQAVQSMMQMLKEFSREAAHDLAIEAVGHRVIHGGELFQEPVVIDDSIVATIDRLGELAPLHNPGCIAGIKAARAILGLQIPMVAVFDTAFHRTIPPRAATYAIGLDLARKHGIRRYGFHGLAHASLARACAAAINRPIAELRLITVQLGNGCSMTAIERNQSVDTSMGFTPLEGLVMGTRSGDLDPAVVAHLIRKENMSADQIEHMLNEQSGLLGLSGLSHDMQQLLHMAESRPESEAALAVDVFCYRVRKYIGAYLAVLGGADAIVFGGGIGERSPVIRARICEQMAWCGLRLNPLRNDEARNLAPGHAMKISEEGASIACFAAGVDEEGEITRATVGCLVKSR